MKKETAERLRELLGTNKACYVVITCDEPSEGGNMQVEMTYEGDPTLAAFLLDSARDYVDSQIEEADLMDTPSFDLS